MRELLRLLMLLCTAMSAFMYHDPQTVRQPFQFCRGDILDGQLVATLVCASPTIRDQLRQVAVALAIGRQQQQFHAAAQGDFSTDQQCQPVFFGFDMIIVGLFCIIEILNYRCRTLDSFSSFPSNFLNLFDLICNHDIDLSGLVNKSLTPGCFFFLILKAGVQMEVTRQ